MEKSRNKGRAVRGLLLVAFIAILCQSRADAQWAVIRSDADSLIQLGMDYIYNVQFAEAEECFGRVISMYPDHPAGYFLDAMVDWWKISLYRGTKAYDERFLRKIDRVLEVCDKNLDSISTDIKSLFFKGGALGYRGRFYGFREEWLSAARDGKNGFDLLVSLLQSAPGNHDVMLGTGIYNYFAAVLPEQYPLLKPVMEFLPRGNKPIGLAQLRASSRLAKFTQVEAKVVLLNIYYQYENNVSEAFALASELHKKYPMNPYFHRYLGRLYVKKSDLGAWERTWREMLVRYMDRVPGYEISTAREALYYIGYALFNKASYSKASKYFKKCADACKKVDEEEASGFRIKSLLRWANCLDKIGRRSEAISLYKEVLSLRDFEGSHRDAKQYIKTAFN